MTRNRNAGTFSAQSRCAAPEPFYFESVVGEIPRFAGSDGSNRVPAARGPVRRKLQVSPRICCLFFFLGLLLPGVAQLAASKVAKIEIQHVGPATVSDELVRANIRVKPGDQYFPAAVDDDVRNLYGTGLFYN